MFNADCLTILKPTRVPSFRRKGFHMSLTLRTLTGLMLGCQLFTSSGCATLKMPFGKDRMQTATARNPVTQVICIWQPSEGRDSNGMPCRGFAGQILFLAGRNSLPVMVEGDVRIYLFDDQGADEEQTKPIHQYDFDTGSWAPHLTKGTLGPTYSVFVPYTRRGTYEAKCALRVRLKPGDEPAVFSDMALVPLDGRPKKASDTESQLPSAVEAKATNEAVSQTLRRTTTISMTGETRKHTATGIPTVAVGSPALRDETPGRVQLANFEEGQESSDPSAQRIEQLEQLVQQLLEQQSGSTIEQVKRAARRVTPASATAPGSANSVPARLVDAAPQHPLSDFDEDAPQPIRVTARPHRETLSHHPLAGLDDELAEESYSPKTPEARPARIPREAATRPARTIRATESASSEAKSGTDSFDPVNTSNGE